MKQLNLSYIILSCILLAFSACSDVEEENMTGTGILRFEVTPQAPVVVTKANELPVTVTVNHKTEMWVKEYTNYSNTEIELSAGSYYVSAIAGKEYDRPGFDPCFKTSYSTTVVLKAGENKTQPLTCYLTTAKVTVVYDDEVREAFAGYDFETIVTNNTGELTFGQSETRSGYFAKGNLSVCFRYKTGGEWLEVPMQDITGAKVRYHYTLKFSLKETEGEPGNIGAGSIMLDIEEANEKDAYVGVKLPRTTLDANAWAKFAYLKGEVTGEEVGDVYFEWRKQGEEAWIEEHNVTGDNGFYQVLLEDLEPNNDYEYRIAGGNIVEFKTQDIPVIPNLDFNTWSFKKGTKTDTWYPNADQANSYWASGNEGVTMPIVGKESNTIGVDDGDGGMYAKLKSESVLLVNFAAGNLFTGTFETSLTNPITSARFGRPYTGRPTRLRGYYKYAPQLINVVEKKKVETDEMDACEIYIMLFQDQATADGMYDALTIPKNPIAYGSFSTDENIESWTSFDIPIIYNDWEKIPTKIAIVATSSKQGAFFTGGVGSELCVDNFELSFDYDPAIKGE